MLYQPQKSRHPLVELARRVFSWSAEPRRMDIRELSGHLRDDIGAPDYGAGTPREGRLDCYL